MKSLSFISLQLEIVTNQCLVWVLASLKKDQMTPTERAIQSRIKEAFAFKIPNSLWECIQSSIMKEPIRINPNHYRQRYSYSEYYNVSKYNDWDQEQEYIPTFIPQDGASRSQLFEFKVSDFTEDPSIGQKTKVIYLKDEEEWVGVDQTTDDIDFLLYDELKGFLQNYLCGEGSQEEDHKWSSSIDNALTRSSNQGHGQRSHGQGYPEIDFEEVRAIPGGRYGCAQFVKICGPSRLRDCSLGKLAQLVQYAVKEDILRYHKTLLVWTTTVDKHKKLAEEV